MLVQSFFSRVLNNGHFGWINNTIGSKIMILEGLLKCYTEYSHSIWYYSINYIIHLVDS